MTSTHELCEKWLPYKEEFATLAESVRKHNGSINWKAFLENNRRFAQEKLGFDGTPLDAEKHQALSYFYHYHITGVRKEGDRKRRAAWRESRASTEEQRERWRIQKRESIAKLKAMKAAGHPHIPRRRSQPIVVRKEDLEDNNHVGQTSSGLMSVLARIEAKVDRLEKLLS